MSEAVTQQLSVEQEQTLAMYVTIAQVAHQVNRAFCQSVGDDSIVAWDEAPDWQIQSAIDGVVFHLANPDATPEQSHKNWMATKTRDGWVYGKTKNPDLKMHPCMIPYNELPQEQRSKDYLFKAIVEEFAKIFGLDQPAPAAVAAPAESLIVLPGQEAPVAKSEPRIVFS